MNRRTFLTTATTVSTAFALNGCNESERVAIDYSKRPSEKKDDKKRVNFNKNKKTVIKLATSWPAHFPHHGNGR